jgi:hypothetical protein
MPWSRVLSHPASSIDLPFRLHDPQGCEGLAALERGVRPTRLLALSLGEEQVETHYRGQYFSLVGAQDLDRGLYCTPGDQNGAASPLSKISPVFRVGDAGEMNVTIRHAEVILYRIICKA